MANLTEGGRHSAVEAGLCVAALNEVQVFYTIFLLVLNILLFLTASIGNGLILYALRRDSLLHPPSKLLLRCLATTDLLVGLVSQPLYVIYLLSLITTKEHQRNDLCVYSATLSTVSSSILCLVSLMTSTAISVDRLLALLLGLRYRQIVTFKRTLAVVIFYWLLDIAFVSFSSPTYTIDKIKVFAAVAVCLGNLVTSGFCYTKIIMRIHHHQNQVQMQMNVDQGSANGGGMGINIARYKKTVSSALWVQLTLTVCYLPYTIVVAVISFRGLTLFLDTVWGIAVTLVFVNSSLNPFLYCWKIREVRLAVKDTIRSFCY
ncbi:histamine H2 receptor-like [Oculina patagonica]